MKAAAWIMVAVLALFPEAGFTVALPADWLAIEREACRRSLGTFIRRAWAALEPGQRYAINDELEVIVRVNPDFQAKRQYESLKAFAAVMGAIARVLYVRAELRFSKGHLPFGKNPASGEVWDKEEIAEAMCRVHHDLQIMLGEPLIKPRG